MASAVPYSLLRPHRPIFQCTRIWLFSQGNTDIILIRPPWVFILFELLEPVDSNDLSLLLRALFGSLLALWMLFEFFPSFIPCVLVFLGLLLGTPLGGCSSSLGMVSGVLNPLWHIYLCLPWVTLALSSLLGPRPYSSNAHWAVSPL